MVWASEEYASVMPPRQGVSGVWYWDRPRTHSGDYISWLAWKCLIDLPDEQGGQRGDFLLREFSAAPMNQTWISVRTWMDGWMDEVTQHSQYWHQAWINGLWQTLGK